MNSTSLTVVMAVTNEETLNESVESYLKFRTAFKNVKILLTDCIGSQESQIAIDSIIEAYGDYIILNEYDSILTKTEAYNNAFNSITGGYVCFTESAIIANDSAVSFVYGAINAHPDSTVEISVKAPTKSGSYTNYSKLDGVDVFCDLNEAMHNVHMAVFGYFFVYSDIKDIRFDINLKEDAAKKFILDALVINPQISYSNKAWCKSTVALENNSAIYHGQYDKDYYTKSIKDFIEPYLNKLIAERETAPTFVQFALCKIIFAKFANNYYENNKDILTTDEVLEFYDAVCDALKFVDNSIYTAAAIRCKYINRSLWMKILKDKTERAGESYRLELNEENIDFAVVGKENAHISTLSSVALTVNCINYSDGKLEFDAEFTGKDFISTEDIKLYVNYDGKKALLEEYSIYPLLKCFGMSYSKKYNVHFYISITDSIDKITFSYMLCGKELPLNIQFARAFSRIRLRFGKAYWKFCDEKALECKNGEYFRVFNCKGIKRFFREIALLGSQLIHTKPFPNAVRRVGLRIIYFITKPYFDKKRIWLTFDKLYKGGDNGEYFFKYANSVKDDVDVYYIIDKNSPDCKRLMEYDKKHILIHNSFKCKLYALNAEAVAATHASVMQYCGIPRYLVPNLLDLFNAKIICIQHGLTVQQLGQYQNRVFDNTTLYCLASKYEKKNLMHPIYGYNETMLKLNGLARYDGLKSNDKKFILITPTWRRNVVTLGIAYKKKPYNEHFKYTEYFRLYNTLINDKKLIECAKKNGYGITYLLHPAMSPQIEDFKQNGFVDIIAASGDMSYEKILTEASLMVTDYSGVQFDFAYMRKPIVYYHPDTLPPHYESGGINYDTQGFGPIITNHEDLVNEICKYMESSCKTEKKYIERANDFFEYDDFNNSERIYREIYENLK